MKKNIKLGSNKSFGIVFSVVFFVISIWPLLDGDPIRYWSIIISIIFLVLGLLNSKLLTPLNKIWFKFGLLLGNIISPIIMGLVFFLVVFPTGILMKLLGKNLLNLNKSDQKTYWIKKNNQNSRMKNQF